MSIFLYCIKWFLLGGTAIKISLKACKKVSPSTPQEVSKFIISTFYKMITFVGKHMEKFLSYFYMKYYSYGGDVYD